MSQSLRFGPHPPDLQPPVDAAPKDGYARFERRDFQIVRSRTGGVAVQRPGAARTNDRMPPERAW
jgi:hypothetical protein